MADRNIEKATITELVAQQSPFTAVGNKVVELIRNPDALAIWTYLQTRAPGWKVIGSHLQDHFDMGRIRYRKAMKDLADLGLLTRVPVRDESGHMAGTRIVVHYQPKGSNPDHSESPSVQVTDRSVGATLGETTPYVSNDSFNQGLDKEQKDMPADADIGAATATAPNQPLEKIPYEQIRELYNQILGGHLPRCLGLNDKHRKHIRAAYNLKLEGKRVVRDGGLEFWEGLFNDVLHCPFLLGQNGRAWQADFAFLTTATKIQAFFEGKYDAR